MSNLIQVKYQDHFKLYILFKDNILFESQLLENHIDYFLDTNQVGSQENLRYFLLDKDKEIIESILLKNKIIASIESLSIVDFEQEKKVQYLYLKVALVISIILVLVSLLITIFQNPRNPRSLTI